MVNEDKPILLFDGVCNFCDGTVNFIIDRDPHKNIRFAALQSESGQQLLKKFSLDTENFDSLVVVHKGRYFKKTSAVWRVVRWMKFPWNLLSIFIVIPPFIGNFFYDIVARNRYKWFGKLEYCRMPTPDIQERFLT
ncbi:thiol-disulfide oxidoreductase DCC family protein [Candidatus Uabimicrobium amorphum]|uniref:Thiol-disulfide oxidoreductase n=1 Tax=Uabimicrobium amorphum TaxID=2596890 RepID=A0A5S9IIP5_UABAM|nr:thiol-disulfide oxidoreductase DCC family protein [Candidatus Uabimicrobium amorphum]BBM82588.1 hypothetical protein UABAM_00931 [Candidatus Uabimicrobium amorphum]